VSVAAAGYFNQQHASTRLTIAHAEDSEPELRWSVAVGMRRADDALVQRLNQALSALLANGTITAIYRRYGIEHRRTPQP
jgi:ABC-type amino acid transport substrate-binding protein